MEVTLGGKVLFITLKNVNILYISTASQQWNLFLLFIIFSPKTLKLLYLPDKKIYLLIRYND